MSTGKHIMVVVLCFSLVIIAQTGVILATTKLTVVSPWVRHADELRFSARKFMEQNPGIEIEVLTSGDVNKPVEVLLAAGSLDGALVSMEGYLPLVKNELVADLTHYLELDDTIDIGDFLPFVTEMYFVDGALYGIPFNWGPCVIYWSTSVFAEAGVQGLNELTAAGEWTWETLKAIGRKITLDKDNDGVFDRYGYGLSGGLGTHVNAWLQSAGGGFVDNFQNPTQTILDAAGSRQALQYLLDLAISRAAAYPYQGFGRSAFINGNVGMYTAWPADGRRLRDAGVEDWDIALMPISPIGNRSTDVGSAILVVSKVSKDVKACYDFMAYHVRNTNAYVLDNHLQSFPVLKDQIASERIIGFMPAPSPDVFIESANHAAFRLIWEGQGDFWNVVSPIMNQYWHEEISLGQAVQQAVQVGNAVIAGYNK